MGSFVNNLIYAVLGINVLAVLLLTTSHFHAETDNTIKGTLIPQVDMSGIKGQYHTYYFDNPTRALRLLEKLDIYEAVGSQDIIGAKYNVVASGFKYNNEYCAQHRALIVEKPEIIFEQVNFITNYWLNHRVRNEVMPKFGKNLHPEVHPNNLAIKKKYALEPSLEATIFFMHNIFFYYRQLGKQYSCLTQESNHIPGHDKMAQKDHLGQALVDYAKRYEKRPHCFNFNKYFPKTWLMQNKEQCEEFFKEFNSPIYKQWKKERKVVYFRKIGAHVHEGKGVFPVTDEEEIYIRTVYENGNKCGIIKHNNLLQYNVHNLLLVTNRKFGFRQYMLIASVNPVIAYFHDGYMRRSLNEYDPNNTDKGTFVTNIGINIKQEDIKMTPDEIQEFTSWSLAKFTQYLVEQNIVKDQTWLDTYLRPEFKKVLIHLVRMAQNGFLPKSSVFELYGIDYVMDENLDLWFIEANATPLIHGFTPESTALINKMLEDTFEIVTGLLRSRMKRIVSFINILSKETDGKEIPNFGLRKSQFRNLTKNFFDDEFKPSPGNTFQKIIDDNLIGKDRYSGLIEEECF